MKAYSVTFIIPVRPGGVSIRALEGIRQLDWPSDQIEILQVEGTNPSRQRNWAAQQAKGELLYFIDDDSRLHPRALQYALAALGPADFPSRVEVVGGPVVNEADDSAFQKALGAAMGSIFGLGPYRHRHSSSGEAIRSATERELLSANLIVRKRAFEKQAGFRETLYPNEENEWLRRLERLGVSMAYHPQMRAYRHRRKNVREVWQQNFSYGWGRMGHFFQHWDLRQCVLLAPLGLAWVTLAALATGEVVLWVPSGLYGVLLLCFSGALALSGPVCRRFIYLLAIFPTMHFGYAMGMWGRIIFGLGPRGWSGHAFQAFFRVSNLLNIKGEVSTLTKSK